MNKLLLTSALVLGLASPALAQTANPNDAVGNASILPGGGTGVGGTTGANSGGNTAGANSGSSTVLPADPGQTSVLPNRNGVRQGSGTGIDTNTTQSVTPDTAVPNATTPNLNQPGTGLNGGVVPNSSGSIPNTQSGSGVPGSTSSGPAGGGSSAY